MVRLQWESGQGFKTQQQTGKVLGPSENMHKTLDSGNDLGNSKAQWDAWKGLSSHWDFGKSLGLQRVLEEALWPRENLEEVL